MRMTSVGKWAPLKPTDISLSLMIYRGFKREIIPQILSVPNFATKPLCMGPMGPHDERGHSYKSRTPARCRYMTLSSDGLRMITSSLPPGNKMIGTTAKRDTPFATRAQQVAWSCTGAIPGAAIPPRYGNRRTVVVRKNGRGSAVYSTSPKIAVMCPRRMGRRCT